MSTNSTPRDLIFDSLMKGSPWEKVLFSKSRFCANPIGSFSSFFLTIMKTLIKSLDFTIFANSYQKNIKKSLMFFLQSIYFVLVFFMVFHFFMKFIDTPPRRHYFSVFFVVSVNIPLGHNSLYQIFIGENQTIF